MHEISLFMHECYFPNVIVGISIWSWGISECL